MHFPFKRQGRAVLAATLLAAGFISTAAAQEISVPEKLLFQTNHFNNIKKPTKLSYAYRQEATPPNAPHSPSTASTR